MADYLNVVTRNATASATIASSVTAIQTAGYATEGDGGGAVYRRVALEPAHPGKVRSADRFLTNGSTDAINGGWWELSEKAPVVQMFGGFDGLNIRAPLNDAIAYCKQKVVSLLRIPRGAYFIGDGKAGSPPTMQQNQPLDTIDFPLFIEGDGRQSTFLFRRYTETRGVGFGMIRFTGQSFGVRHLSIIGSPETAGGSYISVDSPAVGDSAGYLDFEELNLTTAVAFGGSPRGFVDSDIYISGTANAAGARTINLTGSSIFGAENHAVHLEGVRGMNFNAGISTAGGAIGDLFVTGSASVPSVNNLFLSAGLETFGIDHANQFTFISSEVAGSINVASTATNGVVMAGHVGGTITNNSSSGAWSIGAPARSTVR